MRMSAPVGFAGLQTWGDVPGPDDLRVSPAHPLGFTLTTPPPKTALTCSDMGRMGAHLGMQRSGIFSYKP